MLKIKDKYLFIITICVSLMTFCLLLMTLDINTQIRKFLYEYEYTNNVKCEIEYRKGWVCHNLVEKVGE